MKKGLLTSTIAIGLMAAITPGAHAADDEDHECWNEIICATAKAHASINGAGHWFDSSGGGYSAVGAAIVTLTSTKTNGESCTIVTPGTCSPNPVGRQNSPGCNTVTTTTRLGGVSPSISASARACSGSGFDDVVGVVLEEAAEAENSIWNLITLP